MNFKYQAKLQPALQSHFPPSHKGVIKKHALLTFLRGYQSRTFLSNYALAVAAATFLACGRLVLCDQAPTSCDGPSIGPLSITQWIEYLSDCLVI